MSTNPETPTVRRSPWTPEVVFGLLLVIASAVLPHIEGISPGVASVCDVLALWLLGPIRSPLTPKDSPRGHISVGVLLVVSMIGVIALSGCPATGPERNGDTLTIRLRNAKDRPPPACSYRVELDGEAIHYGEIDNCPTVPVCKEE